VGAVGDRVGERGAMNIFEVEEEVGVIEDVLVVNGTFVL
jgi:hypothetical protein